MTQQTAEKMFKLSKLTGIKPKEVDQNVAATKDSVGYWSLNPGYVQEEDNGIKYYDLNSYTEEDQEAFESLIPVLQLEELISIHKWVKFFGILTIISLIAGVIISIAAIA